MPYEIQYQWDANDDWLKFAQETWASSMSSEKRSAPMLTGESKRALTVVWPVGGSVTSAGRIATSFGGRRAQSLRPGTTTPARHTFDSIQGPSGMKMARRGTLRRIIHEVPRQAFAQTTAIKVAGDVEAWCIEHGSDDRKRIVLAGSAGDYSHPGWRTFQWVSRRRSGRRRGASPRHRSEQCRDNKGGREKRMGCGTEVGASHGM